MSDATFNSYFGEAKLVLGRRNLGRPCKGSTSPTSRTPLLPQHVRYMWFLLPKDHIRRALRWLWGFLTCSRRLSGLRVSELSTRSRKRLGRFIVLCSWGKHHTFILPLSTLEYERVPANCQEALMKYWGWFEHGLASHPGGSNKTPSHFVLYKPVWATAGRVTWLEYKLIFTFS